jgi:hypothetical protein
MFVFEDNQLMGTGSRDIIGTLCLHVCIVLEFERLVLGAIGIHYHFQFCFSIS